MTSVIIYITGLVYIPKMIIVITPMLQAGTPAKCFFLLYQIITLAKFADLNVFDIDLCIQKGGAEIFHKHILYFHNTYLTFHTNLTLKMVYHSISTYLLLFTLGY